MSQVNIFEKLCFPLICYGFSTLTVGWLHWTFIVMSIILSLWWVIGSILAILLVSSMSKTLPKKTMTADEMIKNYTKKKS